MRVGTVAFFLLIHFLWVQITDYNHRFLVLSSSLLFFSFGVLPFIQLLMEMESLLAPL